MKELSEAGQSSESLSRPTLVFDDVLGSFDSVVVGSFGTWMGAVSTIYGVSAHFASSKAVKYEGRSVGNTRVSALVQTRLKTSVNLVPCVTGRIV